MPNEKAVLAPILKSIQIALDNYDDIFSDFDISPYEKRTLSDDFLNEIKRRYMVTGKGEIEVRFTLPKKERNAKVEETIQKRLKRYFKEQIKNVENQIRRTKKNGSLRVIIGFLLLSLEVIIFDFPEWYFRALSVFIVPAGWYSFYTGFERLFEISRGFEKQKEFFDRFYKARYNFISEEDLVKAPKRGEVKVNIQILEKK